MSFIKGVEHDAQELGKFARAVVLKRVAIITAVTIIINLAIAYGWVTPDVSDNILHWLNVTIDAIGALVAIGVTQAVVTPSKDPRTNTGEPLVPVSHVEAVANAYIADVNDGVKPEDIAVADDIDEPAPVAEESPEAAADVAAPVDADDDTGISIENN